MKDTVVAAGFSKFVVKEKSRKDVKPVDVIKAMIELSGGKMRASTEGDGGMSQMSF